MQSKSTFERSSRAKLALLSRVENNLPVQLIDGHGHEQPPEVARSRQDVPWLFGGAKEAAENRLHDVFGIQPSRDPRRKLSSSQRGQSTRKPIEKLLRRRLASLSKLVNKLNRIRLNHAQAVAPFSGRFVRHRESPKVITSKQLGGGTLPLSRLYQPTRKRLDSALVSHENERLFSKIGRKERLVCPQFRWFRNCLCGSETLLRLLASDWQSRSTFNC